MSSVNNKVLVQFKDTKDVLSLAIVLGMAIKQSMENKKFDLTDLAYFLPVVPRLGPAFEGIDNVKIELAAASKEEAASLKDWINTQVELPEDKSAEAFIEDAFAILIDLWVFINTYLISGSIVPKGVPTSDGPILSAKEEGTPVGDLVADDVSKG